MNAHELPMITFTVFAQMAVGAFVVLGIINLLARLSGRYDTQVIDEVSNPAAYACGATLVLGLAASALHMNDPFHVLNVFRHIDSSWLSREIVTGMLFAGSGFVFAACQFFTWGSAIFRQVLALVTAFMGCLLVFSMAMVYYTLETVPAWHTWVTPARFATTGLLLGGFAIGTAFMTVVMLRHRGAFKGRLGKREYSPDARSLILASLRGIAILGMVLLAFTFIMQPMHLSDLMHAGEVGIDSAQPYSGALYVLRVVLITLGAGLASIFLFRVASRPDATAGPVAAIVTVAFVCLLAGEFLGRAAFYESMTRIGM